MNSTVILAFYITPAIVIALGFLAFLDHQRFMAKERKRAAEAAATERGKDWNIT